MINVRFLSPRVIMRLLTIVVPLLLVFGLITIGPQSNAIAQQDIKEPTPPPPDEEPPQFPSNFQGQSRPASATNVTNEWGNDVWVAQGPAVSQNGQVENVTPNDEVSGAIHTVAAHPSDADVLYIGATNGGIWKTTNATSASPTWVPLTDQQASLSIGALEFDPTDVTSNTLVAGIGRYSSFSRVGGDRTGLLKTIDGGATWTALDGGGTLTSKNISGVAPRGNTIVLSVNVADVFACSNIGIFRSTNGGTLFTQLNFTNNGMPIGVSYDLASDPTNSDVLYTSAVFATICDPNPSASNGIYRSANGGANWIKVSSPAMDALILDSNTSNVEVSVGNSGEVYVAIINTGNLAGLFRSPNGTSSWVQLDTPSTNENGTDVGLNPRGSKGPPAGAPMADIAGGQGAIHFSIRASNNSNTTVYVGGDRQPRTFGDTGSFPNSIGALDFSGRLFRGDATAGVGSQFVHLTHSNSSGAAGGGTASSSAPHADSREMVFDANGNIIEVDDGGIYRRSNPQNNTGDWFSINGNLQVTEIHDVAYSSVGDFVVSGNQDTGTTYQIIGGGTAWNSRSTADGGDVAIDDVSLAGSNQWILYSSFQSLGGFRRTIFNSSGNIVSTAFPALSGPSISTQFVTPVVVNSVAPTNLLIGGSNGLFESTDQGDTVTQLSTFSVNAFTGGHMLVYGGRLSGVDNQYVIYAPSGSTLYNRNTMGGSVAVTAAPFPGTTIRGVDANPENWQQAYVIDSTNAVYVTTDAGATNWTNVTGNLNESQLHSVEATDTVVFVGGRRGLYMMFHDDPGVWYEVGSNLPTVPVYDIEFDSTDDALVIGTLGRGAWKISDLTSFLETPPYVKRCSGVAAGQTYDFNSTNTTQVEISTLGDLSCLEVTRVGSNHPNATVGLQTGQYWQITGTNSLNAPASGFNVNLTLPASFTPDTDDKVCRYTGTGVVWDCAVTSFGSNSITRNGVTQFSPWATGNNVGPTAVTVQQITTTAQQNTVWIWLLSTALILVTLSFFLKRKGIGTKSV